MADEVLSMWLAAVADSSQFVRVWHFTSKSCLASVQEDRQTLAAIYSSDYKYFATAGSNHAILVYDASTNQVMNSLEARWGCHGVGEHREVLVESAMGGKFYYICMQFDLLVLSMRLSCLSSLALQHGSHCYGWTYGSGIFPKVPPQ